MGGGDKEPLMSTPVLLAFGLRELETGTLGAGEFAHM